MYRTINEFCVDKLSQPNMATSSGLYGKMFIHTISREKIFSIILFLYFVFLILVILILMSNCTDVIVHYRFYMFFFFFFFALDVIVQCMVLRCNRTFIGNDVIMPRLCCTDVIVHGSRTFSSGTDVFVPVFGCTDVIVQTSVMGS